MDLQINHNSPLVMHIDLNSCFATVEQQANPLLRGKPIGVAAYNSPGGCIIAPSIEAKAMGVKVGMRVREGKLLCPNLVVMTPDPPKYRDVHNKFKKIFQSYSPKVIPKSIDEAVIDFNGMEGFLSKSLTDIGKEIKYRMRSEIGEWISCSIGIGTNRFLAKLAAGLKKPDGLDVIDYKNIKDVYARSSLRDLNGINTRYQVRLNIAGIFTPLDLLNAEERILSKQVFKSILGYYWYLRIRGWEIDAVDFSRKSFGQSYALPKATEDIRKLSKLLMKLTEKMGRRLRSHGYAAQGVHVSCIYKDRSYWHKGRKLKTPRFTTQDLFKEIQLVFNFQTQLKPVTKLAVSCYDLVKGGGSQMELFTMKDKQKEVSVACDEINDRYGEYVITPALMMGLNKEIIDRIAFGGVKEVIDLYEDKLFK